MPAASAPTSPDALPAVDTSRRYVRLLQARSDGLVAFEFAIGWPELAVELLLPAAAFAEFCATHRVQRLDADPAATPVPTPHPHDDGDSPR